MYHFLEQAMPDMPEPEIMELNPNDENLILGIPEDVVVNSGKEQEPTRRRVRSFSNFPCLLNRRGRVGWHE
jgi:hypothetical protein